jgi:hypothetical protein
MGKAFDLAGRQRWCDSGWRVGGVWPGGRVGIDLLHNPAGYRQVDENGIELNRATTLDDLDPKAWIGPWQQSQPKGCGRSLVLLGQGAKQKDGSSGQPSRQLKATNLLGGGLLWGPGQQGTKALGFEALFDGPEPIRRLGGTNNNELLGWETQGGQRWCVRHLGWRQHEDFFASLCQTTQGRGE